MTASMAASPVGFRMFRVQTTTSGGQALADALGPYCGDDSVALPAAVGLLAGTVSRFEVLLADGQVAFAGRGQVMALRPPAAGSMGSVRLRVLEVTEETRGFWGALLRHRRKGSRLPPPAAGGKAPPPPPVAEPSPALWASLVAAVWYGDEEAVPAGQGRSAHGEAHDDPTTVLRVAEAGTSETRARAVAEAEAGASRELLAPARLTDSGPTRGTGKSPAYTGKPPGKVMVARKSEVPGIAGGAQKLWQRGLALLPERHRPRVARGAPWLACWGVGVLCGLWWAKGTEPPPKTVAAPVATPTAVALPVAPVVVEAPIVAPQKTCLANVQTEPTGAEVYWGEELVGRTPLEGTTVPCGRYLVMVKQPDHEPVLVNVTATLDGPVSFARTLQRLPPPPAPPKSPRKSKRRR